MSISLFSPVVPSNAFVFSDDGVTFVSLARLERPAVAAWKRFVFPPGSFTINHHSTPVYSATAFTDAVAQARRILGGKLSRACVVFPDSWARTMTLDIDLLPTRPRERREMVAWKVKKLLPGRADELETAFAEIPGPSAGVRLLASAAPKDTLRSVESAFDAAGVRVGFLSAATLTLFDGLDPELSAAAGGDYLFLHRAGGTTSLLIARQGRPLFYRQKAGATDDADDGQEIRLSLSYYADNLGGGEIKAIYLFDEDSQTPPLHLPPGLTARPFSASLLRTDPEFDAHAATAPEVWVALAATRSHD